jgi:hypothetical protein
LGSRSDPARQVRFGIKKVGFMVKTTLCSPSQNSLCSTIEVLTKYSWHSIFFKGWQVNNSFQSSVFANDLPSISSFDTPLVQTFSIKELAEGSSRVFERCNSVFHRFETCLLKTLTKS